MSRRSELMAIRNDRLFPWSRYALVSRCFLSRRKKLAEKLGVDAYELLEEQAKDVPTGSHGIIPTFSNVMNYISWRHAAPSF